MSRHRERRRSMFIYWDMLDSCMYLVSVVGLNLDVWNLQNQLILLLQTEQI